MKFLSFQSILIVAVVLTGCASLTTVNSIEETKSGTALYKNYDSDSQIRFLVSNDENNLHLSLKTTHQPTIAKILRAGLTIYFDKNGKKKKNVYIQYPMGSSQDFSQFKGKGKQKTPSDLKSLINSTSVAAEYVFFEEKQAFTTTHPKSNIQLSLTANEEKELVYDLIIPFDKIALNGKADLFNLSIGIVTGSFDIPSSRPSTGQGGGPSGAGGGAGGGMPQQGSVSRNASYSGGGQRGGGRSGGAPHQGFSELSEESKIWFLVGLYR